MPITIQLPLLHVTLLFGTGRQGGHIHEFVFGPFTYGPKERGLELDPENSEHENLKEWIGGAFDPTAFDVAEVNERLTPSK